MNEKDKIEIYNQLSTMQSLIDATLSVTQREEYKAIILDKKITDEIKNNEYCLKIALGIACYSIQEMTDGVDRIDKEANIE